MKSAKATDDDGPEDAETMTNNEDCLCVTKNGHKTCKGQCVWEWVYSKKTQLIQIDLLPG